MKVLAFILFALIYVISTAFGIDGAEATTSSFIPSSAEGTDVFEIILLNTFQPSYAANIRGLDFEEPGSIYFVSGADHTLFKCDANDGSYQNSWDLHPENNYPFGIADGFPYAHVNDFLNTCVYFYDGSGWRTYDNPYGASCRGMDYNEPYIWEAYSPIGATHGAVCTFEQDGTFSEEWNLPGISSQLSGMTTYPEGTNLGIAVISFSIHNIWFYEFNGSTMTLLGSAALPAEVISSLGLTYSETRDTFFWSYRSYRSGFPYYYISEFEVIETRLESTTWGAIKTSF